LSGTILFIGQVLNPLSMWSKLIPVIESIGSLIDKEGTMFLKKIIICIFCDLSTYCLWYDLNVSQIDKDLLKLVFVVLLT
jgi:hypothetical protein